MKKALLAATVALGAVQVAFAVKNAFKDLKYYAEMAKDVGVESLMSQPTIGALGDAVDQGRGETMVGEQVDYFAKRYNA